MNIDKAGQKAVDAYIHKAQTVNEKSPSAGAHESKKQEQDEISISKAARELQEAQNAVQNSPDVREDRVAAIKKQIQDGTYQVPTEALVDKLLSVFKKD